MKIKLIAITAIIFGIIGCGKSPKQLYSTAGEWVSKDSINLAIQNYQKIASDYSEDSLASVSQYRIARLYLDRRNDMDKGLEALKKVIDKYPQSSSAAQAQRDIRDFPEWIFNRAKTIRTGKQYQDAITLLKFLIHRYPQHPRASEAQYMLGDIYMTDLRDFTSAINAYRSILTNFPGSKQESHAQFMIGYIYANVLNDMDQAKIEYQKFLKKYPDDQLTPSVKFELENLGKDINEIPQLKNIAS